MQVGSKEAMIRAFKPLLWDAGAPSNAVFLSEDLGFI